MMIARLQPGVTAAQAQDALHGALRPVRADAMPDVSARPGDRDRARRRPARGSRNCAAQYQGALLALMVLVTLVLLTTCTNVGNLLMLRNAARRRELTVRAALGAGRSRLVLQYLVESTLLAAIGCAARTGPGAMGRVDRAVDAAAAGDSRKAWRFTPTRAILGFAAGVSLLSALLFGLAPAWRATDVDAHGAPRSSQGSTRAASARRLGRVLVACQVGLSVLLLVGAGLFVQTLRNLSHLDVGFNPDRLLQVSIDTRFARLQARGRSAPCIACCSSVWRRFPASGRSPASAIR